MTPSVFDCAAGTQAAEDDIPYGWGSQDNARSVLERHWDTFITQSDFHYLASIGINTVRLPIGYWNLGPDFSHGTMFEWVSQVYVNCWPRIKRAIKQAGDAGIGVLVDLHGAVGSQNGQQHSGVSDGRTTLFSDPENMDKTIAVLTFLMKQLVRVNNVVGIQVLNEPVYDPGLETFCESFFLPCSVFNFSLTGLLGSRAIDAMRATSPEASTFPIYLHDAFDLDRFANYVASRPDFVVQDHHSYFVFTPSDQAEPASQHTLDVESGIADAFLAASNRVRRNMIIGEWSCALTPQSLADDDDADQVQREFCEQQMKVYANTTAGWMFWGLFSSSSLRWRTITDVEFAAYDLERCDDANPGWCFKNVVGKSLPSSFSSKTKRALVNDDPTGILNTREDLFDASRTPHRFEAIHQRKEAGVRADLNDMNPTQHSFSRGYTDGLSTAKKFAAFNRSKLGFTGQFIKDSIESAGPSVVAPGTEENYGQGFRQGLDEGEARFL
jgi:hypothetical protein